MSKVNLSREQHRRLIQLVAERAGVLTPSQRQNLLELVGLDRYITRLNLDTNALAFAQELVRALQQHGELEETGQPALVLLLRELRQIVRGHAEERAFLDELLRPYEGEAAPEPGPTPTAGIPTAAQPLRLLFLASNPKRSAHLRLGEEMRTIEARLRESALRDRFEIRQGWAVRDRDLPRLLMEHQPHLLHFSGHGRAAPSGATDAGEPLSSELIFEDESGHSRPVPADLLADLFRILRDDIQCVLLNACWSSGQAHALVEGAGLPLVIGMARPIGDAAAIAFAAGFYRALGYGRSVAEAVELGRIELTMVAPAEHATPRLLSAEDLDPASVYLTTT